MIPESTLVLIPLEIGSGLVDARSAKAIGSLIPIGANRWAKALIERELTRPCDGRSDKRLSRHQPSFPPIASPNIPTRYRVPGPSQVNP
jgi:hypothetical protein